MVLLLNREDKLMLCPKRLSAGENHNISLAYPVSDPTNFFGIPKVWTIQHPPKISVTAGKIWKLFSVCHASSILGTSVPQNPCDSNEIILENTSLSCPHHQGGHMTQVNQSEFFSQKLIGSWETARVISLQDSE